MQKLGLKQSLSQKLSPQQIQFIKLLQVPTIELEARVEQELEINPALEEGPDDEEEITFGEEESTKNEDDDSQEEVEPEKELDIEEYLHEDDYAGYKMQSDNWSDDDEDRERPIVGGMSLFDSLTDQLGFLRLDERQKAIAQQLIGSIENDGYIRRELRAVINDLAFSQNVMTDEDEVEEILLKIQRFDPPGIGARNLQECLLLQLERKLEKDPTDEVVQTAIKVIEDCFEEFTKKHYKKIISRLGITEEVLKDAVDMIVKLNPKPGSAAVTGPGRVQYLVPDFILTTHDDDLRLTLNSRNAPELKISRSYSEMLETYQQSDKKDKKLKETVSFVKQKLDAAKWFIDAIRQRQETLLKTMNAIVQRQREFFLDGDEALLKPMILKDIADEIGMDISTVSRVASSKSVQTDFGIFPLKFFFSESVNSASGEDVSSREIKAILKTIISEEDKRKPLSDDKVVIALKEKGYSIARRTVAKYREQLGIPVARMRKEL